MTLAELDALARGVEGYEEFAGQLWLDGPDICVKIAAGADPAQEIRKCKWRVQWRDRGNRDTHNETYFSEGFLASLPSEIAQRTR